MDFFERFLLNMGPAVHTRVVPSSSIERYRGHLPDQLLTYWQEHGWCGYADGMLWTVNPQEYEPVMEAWIGDTALMEEDAYYLIARSAFGHIYLFGANRGKVITIIAPDSVMMPDTRKGMEPNLGIRAFFGSLRRGAADFADVSGLQLYAPAVKKMGPLEYDEMFGFVPALALGGPATLDHLEKVKAVEHLVLLAQIEPLRVLSFG